MEIKNLRKIDKGFLKASFTVSTNTLDINDMLLKEGRDGNLYADPPSKEYTSNGQKKYSKIVFFKDRDLLERISEMARQEYFRDEPREQGDQEIPF